MSKFLYHTACLNPDCGSSDGLGVYEGANNKLNGYCFSCSKFFSNVETGYTPASAPTDSILKMKMDSVPTKDYFDSIGELGTFRCATRQIEKWAFDKFNVKTEVSVSDRSVLAHFYPYTSDGKIIAYKKRTLPKDMTVVGDWKSKPLDLFGQAQARASGSRRLFITEGELDAISLYQVIKMRQAGTKWAHIEPAIVSVCNGAGSTVKDLSRNQAFIKSFDEVVLVMDQDEPGKKATEEALKLIPTAMVATFDEKDANDMLMKGKEDALFKAVIFNAQKVKPSSIVSVSDVYDRALAKPTMGLSWPWPSLTKSTYGIHRKSMYGLGAGVGMGKSEWAKELQAHLVRVHGLPLGGFMLEEDVGRTLKSIAGKFDGTMYHKPDLDYDEAKLRNTLDSLDGKVTLYDHNGVKDWEDIKAGIRYMVVGEGIKDIFIDPLTALVAHLTSSEANDALNTIMSELSGMVHELDFTAYYFCHLNPPTSGPPHERGGKVLEQQFTGSRAMMRWSQYLFGLEGNKDPELDIVERNTRYLTCLKDRYFGNVTRFPMFYNNVTGTLLEPDIGMY